MTLAAVLITSSPVGERGIVMNEHVCLSVCPQEPRVRTSPTVLCMLPMAQWVGPAVAALRYVMYFRFCE